MFSHITMWENEKFTLTEKKFRQINFSKTVTFTKYLPKMGESKFPEFPQCACETNLQN